MKHRARTSGRRVRSRWRASARLVLLLSLVGAMPTGFSPDFHVDTHRDLIDFWNDGRLKAVGNQVFQFEDGLKAIQHIASGKVEGKVVVRVSTTDE